MANGWHIRFQPTIVALTRGARGNFTATQIQPGPPVAAPAGSFQVVISATPKLSERNNGKSPIAPGSSADATVEFIGRPAPKAGTTTPPPWISIGVVKGKVDFNTVAGKLVPRFTAKTRSAGGNSVVTDFTPATTPEIQRSDWVLPVTMDADTFDLSPNNRVLLQMPWQFIENPGRLQLTARLKVGPDTAADENVNTPLDLPLKHTGVPADAAANGTPLTFFGLRNLYTKSNEQNLPNFPFGSSSSLRVILHSTVTAFLSSLTQTDVTAVTDGIIQIMQEAGFANVNVLSGAPADADCAKHWVNRNGHFMGLKITNPNAAVPAGNAEVVPFFDFYIVAESADPADPNELANSEGILPGLLNPRAGTKGLTTPIVISIGTGSANPLRQVLAQIDASDHVNVMAGTICHEIGHTFGLRHVVAYNGQPPYAAPGPTVRGVMGPASYVIGSGTPRVPLPFFGPVHKAEIKRLFL